MIKTLHEAAAAIREGRTTPLELLDECLASIDHREKEVHAWVFVDREGAHAQAEACAAELKKGIFRGPLHGMPIAIKDIIDVFDWPTACGSKLWANSIARQDAPIVANLRKAGAVFLGKTVTTQYASFDPPVTRNPWNLQRTPGGSSSGSAAGLACGMCFGALGSQTGGSITRPASYCGVAGLKPTFGLVNADGILPLAPSMDHPGPMARCVRDLAILLQVLVGSPSAQRPALPDYVSNLPPSPLPLSPRGRGEGVRGEPPRLGRLHGLFDELADAAVRDSMEKTCSRLRERGVQIVDVGLPAEFADVIPRHRTVMAVEGAAYHKERLQRHPEDYGPKIRGLLEEGISTPAPEFARCKDHQRTLTRHMTLCFADGIDALICPATTTPAPDSSSTGDPAFNSPWSYTGLPTVSFPVAMSPDGLPLSLQLVGRHFGESDLLAAAAWCETALGWSPGFSRAPSA